jgi:hypothetical protein
MIRHYLFDSLESQYSINEALERTQITAQALADGYDVKWDDHQTWAWASIDFATIEEAVAFKLRYI